MSGPAAVVVDAPTWPPPAGSVESPVSARRAVAAWYVLTLGLLFVVGLVARTIGLGGAVTEDEDQWIARSGAFANGLAIHDWRRTYLTGHPGVVPMWLTTLTLGVERTRPFQRATGAPDVTTVPDFLPALERARLPFAVLQAGLVVVAAVLLGRLLGPGTGLVAGLLLAAEPFWAGVGPVVGMDGLLTGFLTVSLLALLLASRPGATGLGRRVGWATLAGLTFGLAFLTKTTALFAAPVVPAVALLAGWSAWQARTAGPSVAGQVTAGRVAAEPMTPVPAPVDGLAAGQSVAEPVLAPVDGLAVGQGTAARRWIAPLAIGAGWAIGAALVVWLLWPAAWASPIGTVVRAITFSARLGGAPHAPGTFLLGEPVDDPGPLFYPVALVLRLGPGTLAGLLLLVLFGAAVQTRRVVWTLLGYVALFLILLTVAPKKVDRYLLPILPALAILAAVGWIEAARRLPMLPAFIVALLAFALQVWPLVQAGPYPLAAYNPLVGGVRAAERAIPVGWGDGLDLAGQRIRELAGGRPVVTSIWSPLRVSFGAHAPGPVVSERQIGQADFYVDYVHARQRRLTPRQLASRQPDAVVTIGGVDYARIYRLR
jgi:Dolichyl-phosphate-mannose-protein mannosyltransferase